MLVRWQHVGLAIGPLQQAWPTPQEKSHVPLQTGHVYFQLP